TPRYIRPCRRLAARGRTVVRGRARDSGYRSWQSRGPRVPRDRTSMPARFRPDLPHGDRHRRPRPPGTHRPRVCRAPPRSRPRLPEPARTTPPGTAVWNSWPFSSGFGDREVERFDGSQRIERLPELLWVPDRHNGERFGMQVLPRDAEHVGLGHRRQRLLILLDEVLGIAEILIGEQA